jgi:hypothetical protein
MASGDDLAQTVLEKVQKSRCKMFPDLERLSTISNAEVYFKAAVWENYGSIIILYYWEV